MERERLNHLVRRPTTSPREALAQKNIKNQLQRGRPQPGASLTLDNLTILDIMSFRNGPFTKPPFSTPIINVRNIQHLDLAVVPFWQQLDSDDPLDTHTARTSFKILHNFLSSFPPTHIRTFRFEWLHVHNGPNPLSLYPHPWFSASPLDWTSLECVRFKGVDVAEEDVRALVKRNRALKSVVLETGWSEEDVRGGWASRERGDWEVDVLGGGWVEGEEEGEGGRGGR